MVRFMDYLTNDERGQKAYAVVFLVSGVLLSILISVLFFDPQTSTVWFELFKLAVACGGYLCVYLLAIRRNSGNVAGFVVNIGEIIIQASYGAFGLAINPIFYGATHLWGMIAWNKRKQDDGTIQTKKAHKVGLVVSGIFLVIAAAIVGYLWMNGYFVEMTGVFIGLNILAIILGTIAQGTMIAQFKFAWWFWFASNIVWFIINVTTGNAIFALQTVLYQVNVVFALYDQYKNNK